MEDGNLRLYVLKILLDKKNFLRVKKIINKDFFSNGVRDIYIAICQIYEDNPQLEKITLEDLRISFFETYFANQSVNAQLNIKNSIFLAENLSVVMQVSYFKYTRKKYGEGRRIFKMSPLHHHYQKSGYHESKIVTRFWIIGILLAIISIVTLKIR